MGREHLVEREGASNIHVHNKELLGVAAHNLVSEMVQATSCTECLVFTEVSLFSKSRYVSRLFVPDTYRTWRLGNSEAASSIKRAKTLSSKKPMTRTSLRPSILESAAR